MKKLICLFLLFINCSVSFATSSKPVPYPSVEAFLASQKTIRITVDNSPGFGNQAASAAVITRLDQLGFKGHYELIYANLTTAKITTLFDLPPNIPDVYYDSKTRITFIKLREYINRHKNKSADTLPLTITGASDNFGCGLAKDDGIDVDHGMGPLDCDNSANFTDAAVFAQLTPFYQYENYLIQINDPEKPDSQKDSDNKFFVMPVANLSQTEDYLYHDPRGQALLKQKSALAILIEKMKDQSSNIMPVYGYTIQSDVCEKSPPGPGCFPGNILQIIAGARYAQKTARPESLHKPLIIPVFYDYKKDAMRLMQLLQSDNWGPDERPGAQDARNVIKELDLANTFSVADIEDPNTIETIKNLPNDHILLVWLGPLPKIVFDGLYTYTGANIWPAIREGANSFDSLILTGKPHFRCAFDWELGYDRIKDPELLSEYKKFYAIGNGFCKGMSTWEENTNLYQQLGHFIIEANRTDSSLNDYFKFLKEEALKKENDRIHYALEGVIDILNKQQNKK